MNSETILANLTSVYDDFRQRSRDYHRLASQCGDEASANYNMGNAAAFNAAASRIKSFIHEVSRPRVEAQALFDGFVATRVERLSTAD